MPNERHESRWRLPVAGPFMLEISEAVLADLRRRLAQTRWPTDAAEAGWRYGAGVPDVRRLASLWHDHD